MVWPACAKRPSPPCGRRLRDRGPTGLKARSDSVQLPGPLERADQVSFPVTSSASLASRRGGSGRPQESPKRSRSHQDTGERPPYHSREQGGSVQSPRWRGPIEPAHPALQVERRLRLDQGLSEAKGKIKKEGRT